MCRWRQKDTGHSLVGRNTIPCHKENEMPQGQRAAILQNRLKELWGKQGRPYMWAKTAANKRDCRRIERHRAKVEMKAEKRRRSGEALVRTIIECDRQTSQGERNDNP